MTSNKKAQGEEKSRAGVTMARSPQDGVGRLCQSPPTFDPRKARSHATVDSPGAGARDDNSLRVDRNGCLKRAQRDLLP